MSAECNPGTLSVLCSLKWSSAAAPFGPVKILKWADYYGADSAPLNSPYTVH